MRMIARTTAIAAAITLTAALGACSKSGDPDESPSPSSADTWKVGLEAPMSGDQANLGVGMLQGAQLAASKVNDGGGVLGKNIEIVPIDDAATAATGVTAANAAISRGLSGVVGPYNSGVGIETLPLYLKAGVVPIRLTSDNATDGMGYTLQPMTDQIAPVTARAIRDQYRAKSVSILYDSTQNYTKSTSAAVKKLVEAEGITVASFVGITPGQDNYKQQMDQVSALNPDAVYAAVYYPEGAKIAKEITPKGTDPNNFRCLLDYASYDNGYIADAGDSASKCSIVGVPAPADFEGSAPLVEDFNSQFSKAPGTWSPYTYDSVNLLVEAARSAGSWDAQKLNAFLSAVKDWKGWTGSVTIDPKTGNRVPATVVVTKVVNGEFHQQ